MLGTPPSPEPPGKNTYTLGTPWAAARMGFGAASAEATAAARAIVA